MGGSKISAYFTDHEAKTNVLTVGKVSINLYEPKWDGEDENGPDVGQPPENPKFGVNEGKDIYPLKEIPKDPTIKNTGINSSWIYMEVRVPKAEVITAKIDGTRNERKMTELFSYDVNENWTEIVSEQLKEENKNSKGYNTYIYAYKTPLKGSKNLVKGSDSIYDGEKTTPLFEKIVFANVVEGQGLENKELSIPIRAMAIQADYTGTYLEAYEKYINQNIGISNVAISDEAISDEAMSDEAISGEAISDEAISDEASFKGSEDSGKDEIKDSIN